MHMAKRLAAAVLIALFALGVTFAAFTVTENASAAADTSTAAGASMHRSYREASDIVLATCSLNYTSASGQEVSRFTVSSVYAGGMAAGDTFTLSCDASVGVSYLLYLGRGGGADYAEDESGFVSVSEELITVEGDTARCAGVSYSLSSIIEDFDEQRSVLTVPAQSFYYGDLASLAAACDDVALCRVISVDGPYATQCRSDVKGESISSTSNIIYVTLQTENSFGGRHSYGDIIKVAIAPARTQSVINEEDLSSVTYSSPVKLPAVGGHYVFFLAHSSDAKSDYHFAVNPYQGYVELVEDSIVRPYYNTALDGVYTLEALAARLSELFGF